MPSVRPYLHYLPHIAPNVYIDPSATVIGNVRLGEDSSVWCGSVIRGDVNHIHIGRRSNIQDLAMLHGCTIGNRVLVGMGSIVLDDAVVEDEVVIGAGSLVPPRKRLKSGFLYMGSPAVAVRELTDAERAHFLYSAAHYVKLAADYLQP